MAHLADNRFMNISLASGGISTDERKKVFLDEIKRVYEGVDEILFIPYAGADHDAHTEGMNKFIEGSGIRFKGIHEFEDPHAAVDQAKGIFSGGGNSFLLVHDLHAKKEFFAA